MDFYTLLHQVSTYQGWAMAQTHDGVRYEIQTEYGRTQVVDVTGLSGADGCELLAWTGSSAVELFGSSLAAAAGPKAPGMLFVGAITSLI